MTKASMVLLVVSTPLPTRTTRRNRRARGKLPTESRRHPRDAWCAPTANRQGRTSSPRFARMWVQRAPTLPDSTTATYRSDAPLRHRWDVHGHCFDDRDPRELSLRCRPPPRSMTDSSGPWAAHLPRFLRHILPGDLQPSTRGPGNGLRWAVWLAAGGGIGMTVLSLMADFTTVAISGVNLDAALVTLAETDGFMLDDDASTDGLAEAGPRVSGPWCPCRRVPVACGCDDVRGVRWSPLQSQRLQTMFAPTLTPTADQDAPIMDRYALAGAGTTTSIRSLLALGLDPDAPIDAVVESSARGTSELKVRAPFMVRMHPSTSPILSLSTSIESMTCS